MSDKGPIISAALSSVCLALSGSAGVAAYLYLKKEDTATDTNRDCVQSSWSACNPATMTQTRTTTLTALGTGQACGALTQACYLPGYLPLTPTWTPVLSNNPVMDIGESKIVELFDKTWILRSECSDCESWGQTTYYCRLTPIPANTNIYKIITTWPSQGNVLNTDFELYSSLADLAAKTNKWQFCNYDDPNIIGAFRDCAPTQAQSRGWQWYGPPNGKLASKRKITFSILKSPV